MNNNDTFRTLTTEIAEKPTLLARTNYLLTKINEHLASAVTASIEKGATPAELKPLTDFNAMLRSRYQDLATAVERGSGAGAAGGAGR